jgi:hypothetical protein
MKNMITRIAIMAAKRWRRLTDASYCHWRSFKLSDAVFLPDASRRHNCSYNLRGWSSLAFS